MGIELNNEVVRYTNQRGRFRFKPLAAGTHRLRISFPTYHPIDTLIELAPGEKKRVTLVMKAHCRQWHAEAARADLAAGRVVLLLSSGIAPKVYTTDSLFEATYQLRYYDLGCVVVDNASCMAAYNREVFAHLDALYGRAWRKTARRDLIGY